ncbi:MAG TPA: GNAT family N-acetyltransferase [Anaerolineaceae bacterium]|nr:GNAT family N-acetyltransferase [Anaerolineaceae bacterium]HPN52232.1 GNAT family N-acetyltransferase [Anaerolineaceae bacterium]
MNLNIHEIANLQDEFLLPWLDLYETAFPPSEKILISTYLRLFQVGKIGPHAENHLLAVLNENGDLAGMAHYEKTLEPGTPASLWYLAVQPGQRGGGLGAHIYQHVLAQCREKQAPALLFEVELPEEMSSEAARVLAGRRIQFYERQGALRLTGVHYLQVVGWHQTPMPMQVMVHPLQALTPEQAFELAAWQYEENIRQTGTLRLEK